MNTKLLRILEIAGGFFVFALAVFLHFFYDLSSHSVLGTLLGAVNESVWEHLKIFALPYMVWGTIELLWAQPKLHRFTIAKAVGMYSMCFMIAAFFYLYTSLLGRSILAVDILSGLLFSILGHIVSYKLTLWEKNTGQLFYTGVMLLFLALVMILCFTYYPPQDEIFRDPHTGSFGVADAISNHHPESLSDAYFL